MANLFNFSLGRTDFIISVINIPIYFSSSLNKLFACSTDLSVQPPAKPGIGKQNFQMLSWHFPRLAPA